MAALGVANYIDNICIIYTSKTIRSYNDYRTGFAFHKPSYKDIQEVGTLYRTRMTYNTQRPNYDINNSIRVTEVNATIHLSGTVDKEFNPFLKFFGYEPTRHVGFFLKSPPQPLILFQLWRGNQFRGLIGFQQLAADLHINQTRHSLLVELDFTANDTWIHFIEHEEPDFIKKFDIEIGEVLFSPSPTDIELGEI